MAETSSFALLWDQLVQEGKGREIMLHERITGEKMRKEGKIIISSIDGMKDKVEEVLSGITETALANQMMDFPSFKDIEQLKNSYENSLAVSRSSTIKSMQYKQYLELRKYWPENLRKHLTSLLFIQIGGPNLLSINSDHLFRHFEIQAYCMEHFSHIQKLDHADRGWITESELREYVYYFVENTKHVLEEVEYNIGGYVDMVVEKVLLSSHSLDIGRVKKTDLFQNRFYQEFVAYTIPFGADISPVLGEKSLSRILEEFHALDRDGDGFLMPSDFSILESPMFTNAFLTRSFETLFPAFPHNFQWFILFKSVWESIGDTFSNSALFDVLDVNGDGLITEEDVKFFHKSLEQTYSEISKDSRHSPVPKLSHLMNEFLDFYGVTELKMTADEFCSSKNTEFLIKRLIDLTSFLQGEIEED